MLRAHELDWWTLGAEAVATLAGVVVRMAQNDLDAPISILNREPKE
jgi:hypothetical protein